MNWTMEVSSMRLLGIILLGMVGTAAVTIGLVFLLDKWLGDASIPIALATAIALAGLALVVFG